MDRHNVSDQGARFSNVFLSNTDHPPEWDELGEDEIERTIQQVLADFEGGSSLEQVLQKVHDSEREFAYDHDECEPFAEPTASDDPFDVVAQASFSHGRKVNAPITFAPIDTVLDEEKQEYEKRERAKEAQKLAGCVAEQVATRYKDVLSKMKDRVEFLESSLRDAREARHRWVQEKMTLEEKLEDATMANESLQDRIADMKEEAKAGSGMAHFGAGGKPGKTPGGGGFDFDVDQIDDTELTLEKVQQRSVLAKLTEVLTRKIAHMVPFRRDLTYITRHYGTTFGHFFGFARFLFFLACGILLVFTPLTVPQLGGAFVSSDVTISDVGTCGFAPCAFLLGGFYHLIDGVRDESLALRYVIVSVFSAILCLYVSLRKWAAFDKDFQRDVLEEQMHKRKYAKVAFLCWDFRLKSTTDKESFGKSLSNQFTSLKEEAQLLREESRRTKKERYRLYARRAGGILLNTMLIGGAWVSISYASIFKQEISQATEQIIGGGGAGKKIGELAPNLVVSVVGAILPTCTKAITSLEKWRPSVRLRQTMGRLFVGKILNILIFAALNFELMAGVALFGNVQVIKRNKEEFLCAENQAAASLFSLVMTEFAIGQVVAPVQQYAIAHVKHKVLRKKDKVELPMFEIPEKVVNTTYFQGLILICMLIAPFTTLVAPFLLLWNFKWMQLTLHRLSQPVGASESSDIGVLILRLFCATCAIFCAYSYIFVTYSFPHADGCGPFKSATEKVVSFKTTAATYIAEVSSDSVLVNLVKAAVQTPIYYVALSIIFFAQGLFRSNKVQVLYASLGQIRINSSLQIGAAEREKRRLQRQNDMLKQRLEKSKLTAGVH